MFSAIDVSHVLTLLDGVAKRSRLLVILQSRYRKDYIHFNDDVQGTAAVVTAGFVNGMKAQGTRVSDARVVMFGAGSSAVGVASFLMKAMIHEGLSEEEARKRIFMVSLQPLGNMLKP